MRAVEQAQLGLFPGCDVRGDLHPHHGEIGPLTRGEPVLDHPLGEGLGLDHRPVLKPDPAGQRGDVRFLRRRNDPVDHRLGEGAMFGDPISAVAHRSQHRLTQQCAIPRQIVAGHDGDPVGPLRQRLGKDRDGAAAGQIAFLGHGQRHQPHLRRRDPRDQFRCIEQHLADHPDHPHLLAGHEAVQAILRRHRLAHRRRAQRRRGHAPAEIVEHQRLMCPVKGADAQMDDARLWPRARLSHPGREQRQSCFAEPRRHNL